MTWNSRKPSAGRLRGASVLVVEDEPVVALELEAILGDEGARVVGPASDIEESLRLARSARISVALLDVRLARQSITPVAEALARRGVPFVFYSGQTEFDDVRAAWPKAIFIAKPAPSHRLITALSELAPAAPATTGANKR
jgi:DNA-binding NarL/FixJ family response regulator